MFSLVDGYFVPCTDSRRVGLLGIIHISMNKGRNFCPTQLFYCENYPSFAGEPLAENGYICCYSEKVSL